MNSPVSSASLPPTPLSASAIEPSLMRRGTPRPISVAPMMDRTDRHYRYLLRLISQHTLLYTEMVTTGAIIHGDRPRHLDFSPQEHPLVLQLGGDDPDALATCAQMAEEWGYDEVNLNVGCPSDRVQSGRFGACLMLRPERVAEAVDRWVAIVDEDVHAVGLLLEHAIKELGDLGRCHAIAAGGAR